MVKFLPSLLVIAFWVGLYWLTHGSKPFDPKDYPERYFR